MPSVRYLNQASFDQYGKPTPADAVVLPPDFQPIEELERVRALLKRGRQ